jgi:hypothetical protein
MNKLLRSFTIGLWAFFALGPTLFAESTLDSIREKISSAIAPSTTTSKAIDDVTNPNIDPRTGNPIDTDFPVDPIDQPYDPVNNYGYLTYGVSTRNGSAERLALEVLFQTLSYYGVAHIAEKKGAQIEFKILKSKFGYWNNLTKLDIAFAIREFSRYITAHLCGMTTMENFYRAFAQVPIEEIGLRFKYDFAWALMGNSLPKEPNQMMMISTKWKALQQILTASATFQSSKIEAKELKTWATSISDVVNILGRLNKLMCYVDIRPNPRDEIRKRIVVTKFLEMERRLNEHYSDYKEIIDAAQKSGRTSQLNALRAK